MGDVNASAVIHTDQQNTPTDDQTTRKPEGKELLISQIGGEALVEPAKQEPPESLTKYSFIEITEETLKIEAEIMKLSQELVEPNETPEKGALPKETKSTTQPQNKEKPHPLQQGQQAPQPRKTVFSSIFSLVKSCSKERTVAPKKQKSEQQRRTQAREQTRPTQPMAFSHTQTTLRNALIPESRYDQQDKEQDKEQKEGSGSNQNQQQQQDKQQKKKEFFNIKASRSTTRTRTSRSTTRAQSRTASAHQSVRGVGNIFVRFMALMARILGQAEVGAHELYQRIKERTDNIDTLTLLVSKINSDQGKIDWSNDEEMKALVDKVRALGVDIPEGKYAWSEDEKKLLKENVQLRKDSMEKMTQLERTDMQRYLQEASQCHQARSNVLKLLKEVMDTIIHNMRP